MGDPVLPDPGGRFPADEFRFTKKAGYRAPVHVQKPLGVPLRLG